MLKRYRYKALSGDGVPVEGLIEAHDRTEAVWKIRETTSALLQLTELRGRAASPVRRFGKPGEAALALLCSQFSVLLRAGLPLLRCVELLAEQHRDGLLNYLLQCAGEDLRGGDGLADSFELRSEERLPGIFIETLRAGEQSGTLETALEKLSGYFARSGAARQKLRSALLYPAMLSVAALAAVAVILLAAMPAMVGAFDAMGLQLPGVTRALIALSGFLRAHWLFAAAVIAGAVFLGRIWNGTQRGRLFFSRLALQLPVIGPIRLMNASARFADTMATMLGAGIDMLRAIRITAASVGSFALSRELEALLQGVENGRGLGECMRDGGTLPALLCEMTALGEASASVADTLQVMAHYYENELGIRTERALRLLEPTLILILAIAVALLLISVYLPMFSMYGAL